MNNRIEIAKEFANNINSKYIKKIILFGSVARGEDNEYSDIDILIVSNNFHDIDDIISDNIVSILLDKQELISAHVMSEERFNNTQHYSFLSNVLKDGVVLV